MRKNIIKLSFLFTLFAVLFNSCADQPLVKSEIDNKTVIPAPEVTISEAKDATANSADFTVTLSEVNDALEAGIMYATNPDFSNARSIALELGDKNSINSKIILAPNSNYTVKAYVISKSGNAAYSNSVKLTTPDVPFVEKISGTYRAANIVSYFDANDVYSSVITIKPHEEEGKVIIENLDPFFVGNGYTADKGVNIYIGEYSEANSVISVAAGQAIGYQTATIQMGGAPALILEVKDSGTILHVSEDQLWGPNSGTGYFDAYNGGYNYNKQ